MITLSTSLYVEAVFTVSSTPTAPTAHGSPAARPGAPHEHSQVQHAYTADSGTHQAAHGTPRTPRS